MIPPLNLKAARERVGMTQHEVAKAAGLGPNTVGRIERGETSPRLGTLQLIAVAMGVPLSALFESP